MDDDEPTISTTIPTREDGTSGGGGGIGIGTGIGIGIGEGGNEEGGKERGRGRDRGRGKGGEGKGVEGGKEKIKINYGRVFTFQGYPNKLLQRIIVSVLNITGVKLELIWKTGMLVRYQSNILVLIESHSNAKGYHIFIQLKSFPTNLQSKSIMNMLKFWREIVENTRMQIESFCPKYLLNKNEYIPCIHCLHQHFTFENLFLFPYESILLSIDTPYVYCNYIHSYSRSLKTTTIAPDVLLLDFPQLNESNIIINQEIGKGGFGTVYSGELLPTATATTATTATTSRAAPGSPTTTSSKTTGTLSTTTSTTTTTGTSSNATTSITNKTTSGMLPIAIKVLSAEKGRNESTYKEFQREIFIQSKLNANNIVKLYGITISPPRMILQLVKNATNLYQLLHKPPNGGGIGGIGEEERNEKYKRIKEWKVRYKIGIDIARGLYNMQKRKIAIVHRDLRSPNIFIDDEYNGYIGDFGLSLLSNPKVSGTLFNWQWLPPEVINTNSMENIEYDHKMDQYSFGCILYELASFQIPYNEYLSNSKYSSDGILFKVQVIKKDIIENSLRPTIPDDTPPIFKQIIIQSMSANPMDRPDMEPIVHQLLTEYNHLFPDKVITLNDHIPIKNRDKNHIIDYIKYTTPPQTKNHPISLIDLPRDGHVKFLIFIPLTDKFWLVFSFFPSFLFPLLAFPFLPSPFTLLSFFPFPSSCLPFPSFPFLSSFPFYPSF